MIFTIVAMANAISVCVSHLILHCQVHQHADVGLTVHHSHQHQRIAHHVGVHAASHAHGNSHHRHRVIVLIIAHQQERQHIAERRIGISTTHINTREEGGYGLGLSIAEKITENFHGKITAEAHEDGNSFTVNLPHNDK